MPQWTPQSHRLGVFFVALLMVLAGCSSGGGSQSPEATPIDPGLVGGTDQPDSSAGQGPTVSSPYDDVPAWVPLEQGGDLALQEVAARTWETAGRTGSFVLNGTLEVQASEDSSIYDASPYRVSRVVGVALVNGSLQTGFRVVRQQGAPTAGAAVFARCSVGPQTRDTTTLPGGETESTTGTDGAVEPVSLRELEMTTRLFTRLSGIEWSTARIAEDTVEFRAADTRDRTSLARIFGLPSEANLVTMDGTLTLSRAGGLESVSLTATFEIGDNEAPERVEVHYRVSGDHSPVSPLSDRSFCPGT